MNQIELYYINNFKNKITKLNKEDIYNLVTEERNRQDKLFGNQPRNLTIPFWMTIATEEFGEISKAYIDNNPLNFKEEVIQTIAVLVAMLEDVTYANN